MSSRPKVDDIKIDRALLELWRRLDKVEKATRPAALQTVANSSVRTICFLYGATGLQTVTNRRWLNSPGNPIITTVGGAYQGVVPDGITQLIGLTLITSAGGTGGSFITFRPTVGNLTSEVDSDITITTASTFSGTAFATGSFPCSPGQTIRVAVDKTTAMTTQSTGIGVGVIMSS